MKWAHCSAYIFHNPPKTARIQISTIRATPFSHHKKKKNEKTPEQITKQREFK